MTHSGLYKIINIETGSFYLGSAYNFNKRWNRHLNTLKNNTHPNKYLQNAWNKYGESSFIFTVFLLCNKENMLKYEQFYLNFYYDNQNKCYNMAKLAGGGRTKEEMTPEIIAKIVKSKMGTKHSIETKQKMSAAQTGEKNHNFGTHMPKETKIKKANTAIKNKLLNKKNKNNKFTQKIINNIRKSSLSVKELAKKYKVSGSYIREILRREVWNTD